jgi:hypothetical protein
MLKHALPAILISLLLSGCATQFPVATDYDAQYSFADKTRYAIIIPDDIKTTRNDLLRKRIEQALHRELQNRGWQETDQDQAQIWVSYFATSEKQQDIRTWNNYNAYYGYARCYRCYYPAPMATTEVQVVDYIESSLLVDMIDPTSNTLKWRGSTRNKVTTSTADNMTVTERTERINNAVAAILAQFPPAPGAQPQ